MLDVPISISNAMPYKKNRLCCFFKNKSQKDVSGFLVSCVSAFAVTRFPQMHQPSLLSDAQQQHLQAFEQVDATESEKPTTESNPVRVTINTQRVDAATNNRHLARLAKQYARRVALFLSGNGVKSPLGAFAPQTPSLDCVSKPNTRGTPTNRQAGLCSRVVQIRLCLSWAGPSDLTSADRLARFLLELWPANQAASLVQLLRMRLSLSAGHRYWHYDLDLKTRKVGTRTQGLRLRNYRRRRQRQHQPPRSASAFRCIYTIEAHLQRIKGRPRLAVLAPSPPSLPRCDASHTSIGVTGRKRKRKPVSSTSAVHVLAFGRPQKRVRPNDCNGSDKKKI